MAQNPFKRICAQYIRTFKSNLNKYITTLLIGLSLSACSNQKEVDINQLAAHTGNTLFENNTNLNFALDKVTENEDYYVYTRRLRLREGSSTQYKILGVLSLNDQVKVLEKFEENDFVKVLVVKTQNEKLSNVEGYLSFKYLGTQKQVVEKVRRSNSSSKYFIIQNVATEILRVYKKGCSSGSCPHKLVMETEIAVGEKTPDRKRETAVGYFHISSWHKFYQDGAGLYPSWYDPNYPKLPGPGSSAMKWSRKKYLPNKRGSVRGAFGWYTAKVSPNSHYQWTHGTLGWGKDKKEFIDAVRGFWANIFSDPRSHGCSRTDNESIAYIRHLVSKGATLIKVYAKEDYADESRSRYDKHPKRWDYILTKNGVRKDGEKADRGQVLANGTASHQWLEQGTYEIDAYPNIEKFKSGSSGAKSGKNGNVYGYKDKDMRGIFLIDEGRLVGYKHPRKSKLGGYKDQLLPPHVVSNGYNSL